MTHAITATALAAAVYTVLWAGTAASARSGASLKPPPTFGPSAQIVLSPDAWNASIAEAAVEGWNPATNASKSRGDTAVCVKVAPAVVVVRTRTGHGTGFFIRDDGLLLTNNHVVAQGASPDAPQQASTALVYVGQLTDAGTMQLVRDPIPAYIYKVDRQRDLALLKLSKLPNGTKGDAPSFRWPRIPPRPAQSCSVIGHPAAGLLWTYRSCEVSGLGFSPEDLVDVVMPRLAFTGSQRRQFEDQVSGIPKRRIVLTSCGANPGDSGGPVVNDNGNLVAVTFATPADPTRAKFSYHIHPDEVRAFLGDIPNKPVMVIPEAWVLGPRVQLIDLLHEGRPQTLISGLKSPEEVMFDLDGDTPRELLAKGDLRVLIGQRRFDAEAVFHFQRDRRIAFYDSDNDGIFDIILEANNSEEWADTEYRLGTDQRWVVRTGVKLPWVDARRFTDAKLGARLQKLAARLHR